MGVKFVHLHVHSEYSLLESSIGIKKLAKKSKAHGAPACALTDFGNMYGAAEFYFACKDNDVKPLVGIEIFLAPGNNRHLKTVSKNDIRREPTRLVLLAQNLNGYRNLCQISTAGFMEGFYYKPRVDEEVLRKHSEDIIVLSGGLKGDIVQTFLIEGVDAARKKIQTYKEIFGDRFYLEVTRLGHEKEDQIFSFLQEQGEDFAVKRVAANDVHYLEPEDRIAQEVLLCIGNNQILQDETRQRLNGDQYFLKSPEQMLELFKDAPELCDNTLEISERCDLKFKLKDDQGKPIYHLPSYPTREGLGVKDAIREMVFEGLVTRTAQAVQRKEVLSEEDLVRYRERIDYELGVIDRMGFNGYFLIVADFINWAKQQGIPVGPGRGSGAGSLVAFCLNITDLDPMPYKLLFERFLNPERISMPDFDIDFCQDRRGEVIRYVTEKYGSGSVSQIVTYGKLQARAALRDVARTLGMSFAESDIVSKLIPEKLNITLTEALEMEPRLKELMEADPQVSTLMDLALRIEGLVRHAGIHAAGVIIADGNLVDHAPLCRGANGESVVQYDMKHAEKIGLIKFDFLGLKTLTHIRLALKLIETSRGEKIQESDISLSDPSIYEIMSAGDTAGIFQFEGEGITDAIRKIKPSSFFDITAINALYRPGPMAMIPEFAARKNGEAEAQYIFEELKEVLEETYGIIVYQEQVMAIASRIAGYSLGQADMLRRAMGKKNKEEMDRQRELFLHGAKERGFDVIKSNELFDLMYKFADYGFNKSHAAAYCVLAAQTAYLKKNYPQEFFAALLSTELGDTDKVVKYVKDAQRRGLLVKPPHVNHSQFLFTVKNQDIYFGLGAIKGLGEAVIEMIIRAREESPEKQFKTLDDFFSGCEAGKLNKKSMECLIKAGALDGFGYHRAELMAGYAQFLDRASENFRDQSVGQVSLFSLAEPEAEKLVLARVPQWTRSASLAAEKEVLGFFLSDHPLRGFELLISKMGSAEIAQLPRIFDEHQALKATDKAPQKYDFRNRDAGKKRVQIVGTLTSQREIITKKGTRMAFGQVEDLSGSCELVVFPDMYAKHEALLKDERPLVIGGFLECENNQPKIMVDQVSLFEQACGRIKRLVVNVSAIDESEFATLFELFAERSGETPIEFVLDQPEGDRRIVLETETEASVLCDASLFDQIQSRLGRTQFLEIH